MATERGMYQVFARWGFREITFNGKARSGLVTTLL